MAVAKNSDLHSIASSFDDLKFDMKNINNLLALAAEGLDEEESRSPRTPLEECAIGRIAMYNSAVGTSLSLTRAVLQRLTAATNDLYAQIKQEKQSA